MDNSGSFLFPFDGLLETLETLGECQHTHGYSFRHSIPLRTLGKGIWKLFSLQSCPKKFICECTVGNIEREAEGKGLPFLPSCAEYECHIPTHNSAKE